METLCNRRKMTKEEKDLIDYARANRSLQKHCPYLREAPSVEYGYKPEILERSGYLR